MRRMGDPALGRTVQFNRNNPQIHPLRIVPMLLATDFVLFVSRCTGDGLDHVGRTLPRPLTRPDATPKSDDGLRQEPRSKPEARDVGRDVLASAPR